MMPVLILLLHNNILGQFQPLSHLLDLLSDFQQKAGLGYCLAMQYNFLRCIINFTHVDNQLITMHATFFTFIARPTSDSDTTMDDLSDSDDESNDGTSVNHVERNPFDRSLPDKARKGTSRNGTPDRLDIHDGEYLTCFP